jgi:hypothetical protein
MNDTSKNVRAYIYALINGNITHDASAVPVVAKPTDLTTYPYIVIQSSNFADDSLKDRFYGVHEVEIQVHTKFPLNFGGQDDCDEISNSILNLVRTRNATSDFGNDTMFLFKQTTQRYINDDDGQFDYYTKSLFFDAEVISNS